MEGKSKVWQLLIEFAREHRLTLIGIQNRNIRSEIKREELAVEIAPDFSHQGDILNLLDCKEIIRLLRTEARVNSINWQFSSIQ